MNANEFMKKIGFKAAKSIVNRWPFSTETDVYLPEMKEYTYIAIPPTETDPYVSLADLQRIVESCEIVESLEGLDRAKLFIKHREFNLERGIYFKCTIEGIKKRVDRVKQAVLDVESITVAI